jgi:GAF domain-containing protein
MQILLTLLPNDGAKIRCTYHCPVHNKLLRGTQLAQVFDYIPDGGGGGRRFPIEKGIIGKVYSIKAPRVENFASDEEYRTRMVNEYNYTITEMMERAVDRRSYACYPVIDENHKVLGLLFFDSDQTNTFTMEQTNARWRAIRDAGDVIRGNILAGL